MPNHHASCGANVRRADEHDVAVVPITQLRSSDSPRLNGIDEAHARLLAESVGDLPAILVQRGSMRVIDGMHRVRAAQIKHQTHIAVSYVDDDDDVAFRRSVAENIEHGLPLTLADRKAAAARIIQENPQWSDRAVAKATGLSGKTVGALRQVNQNVAHLGRRTGRDGKVRPVDGADGRRLAGELLADRPNASVREIAAAAGVSPATAHDVRKRLQRGEPPTTATRQTASTMRPHQPLKRLARVTPIEAEAHSAAILNDLRKDPAIRYTEAGRNLLRWLCSCPSMVDVVNLAAALPTHCLPAVARLTRDQADFWMDFANFVEQRAQSETA